jgi:hypothetical protein
MPPVGRFDPEEELADDSEPPTNSLKRELAAEAFSNAFEEI